jgi:RNA polymerase-binding transcription factor DksA
MQISRNDDEQSIHLKTSSEASEEKIDQQTEHINDFNQIHLKDEHRKSLSHLSDHCTVSIHLLHLDLIRSQRRARL